MNVGMSPDAQFNHRLKQRSDDPASAPASQRGDQGATHSCCAHSCHANGPCGCIPSGSLASRSLLAGARLLSLHSPCWSALLLSPHTHFIQHMWPASTATAHTRASASSVQRQRTAPALSASVLRQRSAPALSASVLRQRTAALCSRSSAAAAYRTSDSLLRLTASALVLALLLLLLPSVQRLPRPCSCRRCCCLRCWPLLGCARVVVLTRPCPCSANWHAQG